MANHKENNIIWNGDVLIIKEGQFLTGRKQLSEETCIPETTIERALDYFEKNGHQIKQQKTTKFRIITILNWSSHQLADSKADNRRTTDGQQTDTNKNDKNDNNEKNIEREGLASLAYLSKIPEEDMKEFMDRFIATKKEIEGKAEGLKLYCESRGKKYKNYKAFLLNALKRDFKEKSEENNKYKNL